MAKIIIIYTTNADHEYSSRELIGAATSEKQRDRLVRKFLREYIYENPSRDEIAEAIRHLHEYGQTKCLNGPCDLEIDTDVVETNQLCV